MNPKRTKKGRRLPNTERSLQKEKPKLPNLDAEFIVKLRKSFVSTALINVANLDYPCRFLTGSPLGSLKFKKSD